MRFLSMVVQAKLKAATYVIGDARIETYDKLSIYLHSPLSLCM